LHDLELNSVSDIFGGISTSAFFKGIYNNYLVDISKKKYNTSLDYRGNLSINFYPGDWLDLFEPLLFNVSVSDTRSEYIEQIPKNENAFDLIDKPQNIRGSRTRGYLYKGTLYPALLPLNFTQTFQHNKTTSRIYETFTIKSYKRYYSKLELFPRKPSKVIGDLLQVFEETIHSEKKVEKVPSLTFDSLLSSSLLVKLKIRMDIQEIKQGIKSQNYIDVEPTVRIVYRIRTIPKFGRFDLTLEGKISYSYENHEYYGAAWKNLIQSEWWFQKNLYALFTFTFKDEFGEYNKPVSYSTNLKFNFVF
jgi:hypothetical protein